MNPKDYYYQQRDMRRFKLEAGLCNSLILILFGYYILSEQHLWLCYLLLNIALVRWMLAIHELFHYYRADELNPLLRTFLIPFSPINIGYQEYQQLHTGHHRFTATEQDPDAFHIRGGHLRSFLGALRFPEQCSWDYLKNRSEHGVSNIGILARFVLFISLAWWGGVAFWLVWLALRINYAISIWIFFHHLHYRQQGYGSFELSLPALIQNGFALLYGKPALLATMHHDVHHQWPKVAAWHLPTLRPLLQTINDEDSNGPAIHPLGPKTTPAVASTRDA